MKKPSKRLGILIAIASFAIVATIVTVLTRAATPTASIEVGSASNVTAPASVITDATASGGNAVQFKAAPVVPPGSSRCPAYPAYPDAACTGTLPGATLQACSSNITQSNLVLDKCLFSNGVGIAATAKNVKITNSKVLGAVYCATSNCNGMGLSLTDVEIDGQNWDDGVGGITGYTCLRCEIHNSMKLIAGGNFHVEDSYLYDVYGEYSCTRYPGDCQSHNEAVLPFSGNNNTLLHNNISANWSQGSTGNGMSAAIALYTHSSFWGGINNVLIEKNRIANTASPYCMYLGNTSDSDGNPSNLRLIDNQFVSCNVFLGWLRGNGNVWSGNKWADGSAIAEPSTGEYN